MTFGDARFSPVNSACLNVSACVCVYPVSVCVCVLLCVLVSVCVSVWSVAEGGVSSNLGQSRDGKVNSAVKHREIETHTYTQTHTIDKYTYRHIEKQAHKRRYLWET